MGASTGPQGGPWFRVPAWVGGRYRENRPATDAEAWVEILGRWHQGEDVSLGELCGVLQWGKGRVIRLHAAAAEWAAANGATVPARIHSGPKTDRKRTAQRTGPTEVQAALSAASGPETDRTRGKIGPETDREPEKERVSAPLSEPLEERELEKIQTQSARKTHPGWTSLRPLPPAASPVEIQPEADPELDAHLAKVFAPEAEPVAAPPPKKPLFACWVEQPKPAVVEEEPEEEDPLPADHLLLLTTRPDGSPAEPLAVASRLAGKLISVGIATPADLELATTDDVAKAVGKPGMQAVDRALRAWGTKLLLPTRAMVEDIRARAQSGKADLSPVEEALLEAAKIKLSDVRNANDWACHTLSQRIDAARSTL